MYKFLTKDSTRTQVNDFLLSHRINWKCTPERAPHFGGHWEAVVKSAKFHLKRVIGKQRLDYEEFSTIATKVESCLNSRPLLQLDSYSQDGVSILTPDHFLIGRLLRAYPEVVTSTPTTLLCRWTLCQNIFQHFWKRWSSEYLQQLQRMNKWRCARSNLSVDDVVIRENSPFCNHWPLARVTRIFPGNYDKVRVVEAKSSTSFLKCPIYKLTLLVHGDCELKEGYPA